MGILNAIFAPFIVVYLLMYSFFRYFEVRPFLLMMWLFSMGRTGILQEPVCNQRSRLHPLCAVEVPGIQRAAAPV